MKDSYKKSNMKIGLESNKYDKLIERVKGLWTNNKLIFIVSFIAGLITHFYFFTNEVLCSDALFNGNIYVATRWEMSLGRWGLHIIDLMRGKLVNSFLIAISCILLLALTTIVLVKLLKIKRPLIIAVLAALMVMTPQIAETLMCVYCADSYCLAILLSTLSVYFIYRNKSKIDSILSILCIIIFLSLYQSYIGILVSLCIIIPIINLLNGESANKVIKEFIRSFIISIAGTLYYYFITVFILHITNNTFSTYAGANTIGISTLQNFIPEFINTYKTFYSYFFEESIIYNDYWNRDIINAVLAVITLVNLVIIILKNKIYKQKLNFITLIILILLIPVGINAINIIAPERDNNLLMGMSYVLVYVFALKVIDLLSDKVRILKHISVFAIIILLSTFVFSNTATYMSRKEVHNQYYATSIRILSRIESYEEYTKEMPVLIGGLIRYKPQIASMANGYISNSYETYNRYGGVLMINDFYSTYMGETINLCSTYDYLRIIKTNEYKQMGIFPEYDSIKVIDGILVVKLQNNPPVK